MKSITPIAPHFTTMQDSIFFSPTAILSIFNAAITTKEEKKIIQVRGIFKKTGTANYGGNYYNRLKDEASDNSITLITPILIHNQLDDNKTIEFNSFITRRLDKQGRIEININIIELLAQKVNKFSEEDTKKIELINQKVIEGFKDLDAHIKNAIFHNQPINIKIIMGRSGIIDSDIKKGMEESIALYNIEYHRISLASQTEIINKIKSLDQADTDVICIARGGGDNLSIFENLDICGSILQRNTIIASAIGHADDVSLFEKLSDKKFSTPTQFGNYLKEIYNNTVEELENSKAKLVHDITIQLTTNYNKQIENLNSQLKSTQQLNAKTLADTQTNYHQQVLTLNTKLKSFEELVKKTNEDKSALHTTEVTNLKKQIESVNDMHLKQVNQINNLQNDKMKSLNEQILLLQNQQAQKDKLIQQSNNLAGQYQKQLSDVSSKTSLNLILIIIAAIAGLILGALIFKK